MYVVAEVAEFEEGYAPQLPGQEIMKTTVATTYVLFGKLLGPARVVPTLDADRSRPIAVMNTSATVAILETKLPAEQRDIR
ncbi:MAG TPA: hypothetical protein VNX02_09010 [Steroidobacteraceae bacterium]|nr:hypothetical protein [Steroidobacteraceae bacterium]